MAKDFLEIYTRLYVGEYDMSGDSRTYSGADASYEAHDLAVWTDEVKPGMAGPMTAGLTGYQALLNDAAGRAFQVLKDAKHIRPLSLLYGGGGEPAAGDPAYLLGSQQMGDKATFNAGVGVMTADFMPVAGEGNNQPWGNVLVPNTLLTATGNGASLVAAASSPNGAHAILHVLASDSGDYAFEIEHSADGESWAQLLEFTLDGSAVGSEHIVVSGEVDEYVRFVRARTGGEARVVCTFARN